MSSTRGAGRLPGRSTQASTEGPSPPSAVAAFERIVNVERRLLTDPVGLEVTVMDGGHGDIDEAAQAAAEEDKRRFECTPEILARVALITERYESKVYPDQAEADGEAPPIASQQSRPPLFPARQAGRPRLIRLRRRPSPPRP